MQKVFIELNQFSDQIILDKNHTKHLLKVLRKKIGDQLVVVCNHKKYLYEIININPLTIKQIDAICDSTQNNFELNVFFASIKTKNLEWAVQKATELNVNNFYLINFNYSQGNEKINVERIKTIILNASQQANRDNVMNFSILEKKRLEELLNANDINFIAHLTKNKQYLSTTIKDYYQKIGLVIGPEGGFSDKDISLLTTKNSCIISMTKTILRSETALIYGLSVINEMMLRGK